MIKNKMINLTVKVHDHKDRAVILQKGVGGRADFCSCKIGIHAILGDQIAIFKAPMT